MDASFFRLAATNLFFTGSQAYTEPITGWPGRNQRLWRESTGSAPAIL
jgi:hypothetical protein